MTSDELIGFVENKFEKHGVKKVVPDDETLQLHARRMLERQMVLQELDNLLPGIRERVAVTALPDDLRVQVEKWLEEHPTVAVGRGGRRHTRRHGRARRRRRGGIGEFVPPMALAATTREIVDVVQR